MPSTILYGHPVSQPSRSCQWFIDFTNQKVQIVAIDTFKAEHKKPEFIEKFPNGQFPALEDGGFYLSESMAILKYLARNDLRFTPKDSQQQARLDEYLGRHYSTLRKISTDFFRPFMLGNKDMIEPGYESIKNILEKFDARLGTQPYVLGDSLTLADFLFVPEVDQLQVVGERYLEPFKNIRLYLDRLTRDVDGYKKCFDEMTQAVGVIQAAHRRRQQQQQQQ
eukprot:TRINITY_DN4273_c0_g1_i1.p1 TRINITY_DN4273_c0_g1~~TRINITY_DN4273_c0_g1_i1.p1  ORF type:complete len:223 (+),score=48.12 TRINITY_DN4273_c0_g1_i1:54-722(+)